MRGWFERVRECRRVCRVARGGSARAWRRQVGSDQQGPVLRMPFCSEPSLATGDEPGPAREEGLRSRRGYGVIPFRQLVGRQRGACPRGGMGWACEVASPQHVCLAQRPVVRLHVELAGDDDEGAPRVQMALTTHCPGACSVAARTSTRPFYRTPLFRAQAPRL